MAAVGEYIRALREGQHITRTGLADQLDVDTTTLWRVEEGKQEPSGPLLISLVSAVRGSFEDVQQLVATKGNGSKGKELAELRLQQVIGRGVDAAISQIGRDEAADLAERLEDPVFFERFIRSVYERGKRRHV